MYNSSQDNLNKGKYVCEIKTQNTEQIDNVNIFEFIDVLSEWLQLINSWEFVYSI